MARAFGKKQYLPTRIVVSALIITIPLFFIMWLLWHNTHDHKTQAAGQLPVFMGELPEHHRQVSGSTMATLSPDAEAAASRF